MNLATNFFLGLTGVGLAVAAVAISRVLLQDIDIAGLSLLGSTAAVAAACAVSFKFSVAVRQVLAICILSAGIAVLAAEFIISPPPKPYLVDGGVGGKSGVQALLELRATGKPAYVSLLHSDITIPDEAGRLHPALKLNGKPVLPMSGVARIRTSLCNETGDWISYVSDQYGFRNPESSWHGMPDIATVGDSYTQGNCVEDGKSYVDRLRASHPRTLNLGQRGNGPFAILASIREYLPAMKPAITIWFHFEGNDIPSDIIRERRTPIFQEYLKPDFSQALQSNGDAVSDAFANNVDLRLATAAKVARTGTDDKRSWTATLKSKLFLYNIRNRLGVANFPNEKLIKSYKSVLARAKNEVAGWSGELLLVYLPTKRRFASAAGRRKLDRFRRRVLGSSHSLDTPVLDLTIVFEALTEPERYYDEHLTEEGHAIVAQEVERFLKSRAR